MTTLRSDGLDVEHVRRLQQQAAADALHFEGVVVVRQRHVEDAQVLLGRQHFPGGRREGRGDQHFDEVLALVHGGDDVDIDGAVEGDDAAEGRGRIGLEGLFVGAEQLAVDGDAARVGVLDDDAGRAGEGLDAFPGGIGVADVVVRQFLALQLGVGGDGAWRDDRVAVEGGLLVRVLAVAQGFDAVEGGLQAVGNGESFGASSAVDSSAVSQLAIAES